MRRTAMFLLLVLVLIAAFSYRYGIVGNIAQANPIAAVTTTPPMPTLPAPAKASTPSNAAASAARPEPTIENYCSAELMFRTSAASLARFRQRHSDIAIADADLKSLFTEMAPIWHLAAMAFIDHDSSTFTVIADGKYQGRDVRTLESDAVGGDATAALHYGSYLMADAYLHRPQHGQAIDHDRLERGRNMLMQAYRAGQPDALYRIYMNTATAARMVWRWQGRTPDWQALDAEQYALEEWLLQHGPSQAAAILVRYDRDNSQGTRSPLGEPYPADTDRQPEKASRRVEELAQEIHAPALTAAERQLRDQFQWMHGRDLIINVMLAWGEDCEPNAIDK